jgi:hypothetical protein
MANSKAKAIYPNTCSEQRGMLGWECYCVSVTADQEYAYILCADGYVGGWECYCVLATSGQVYNVHTLCRRVYVGGGSVTVY